MMRFQQEHEHMAGLLDLMLVTNEATDPRARANQALDWLMARDGVISGGVWLAQLSDLVCLARRNLDLDDVVPVIQWAIEAGTQAPLTSVYQQDLRLTILPLGITNDYRGALVVITQAPPDPGELLLLRAVAAHLAATITRPQPWPSQRAGASDRVWEEFLAHAAHEIKNPLASIKGYADLLLRRASRDPADPLRKGLTIISQQVARTLGLLEQLSDVARIGTDRLALDRRNWDLAELVRRSVDEHQGVDELHSLVFEGDGQPLHGSFDVQLLEQVGGAMLSNAIKFSPNGGPVVVRLRRADASAPEAILAVVDQGIGVPAGEEQRVFDRFFRGSNVSGSFPGLGLGLFVTREIVVRHGGRMWIQSAPERGTRCFAALPLT